MQFKEFLDYLAQNSTKPVLIDAVMEGLNAYTGSIQDRMYKYLKDLGYTGSLTDMIYAFTGVSIPDYWYAQFNITANSAIVGLSQKDTIISNYSDIEYKITKPVTLSSLILYTGVQPTLTTTLNSSEQSENGNALIGPKNNDAITSLITYNKQTNTYGTLAIPNYGSVLKYFYYANGYFYLAYQATTGIFRIKDDFSDTWTLVSSVPIRCSTMAFIPQSSLHVLVNSNGYIMYSYDGLTWTQGAYLASPWLYYCTANPNGDVLITKHGYSTAYLTNDGINVTNVTLPEVVTGESVFAEGKYVLSCYSNGSLVKIAHSSSGLTGTWSLVTIPMIGYFLKKVYYSKLLKTFFAFNNGYISFSKDLSSWTNFNTTGDGDNFITLETDNEVVFVRDLNRTRKIDAGFSTGENIKVWADTITGKIYANINNSSITTEYDTSNIDLRPVAYDPLKVTIDKTSIIATHPDANDWQPYGN